MTDNRDDTFLARWLNNELSEKELTEFQASPDYIRYQKILKGTEAIRPGAFDTEAFLERVKTARQERQHSPKIRQLWTYGIAASIALLIAFFLLFDGKTTHTTSFGEQLAVFLPDSSEVILNARSKIVFNERNWDEERLVSFDGEAFFRVSKGNTFTVTTDQGDVTVLGTQFNVLSTDGLFEVTCYEGKVRVSKEKEEQVLLPGQTFRWIDNAVALLETKAGNPGWVEGESAFKSMPVRYVLEALEKQYDIDFETAPDDPQLLFTGSFPHDDLEVALRIVLGSLQIEYSIKDDKVILRSKS